MTRIYNLIIPGSLSKTKESNNTFCHVIMSFSIQFVIEKPELQPWLWCFISPFIKSNPVKRRNKIRSCGALNPITSTAHPVNVDSVYWWIANRVPLLRAGVIHFCPVCYWTYVGETICWDFTMLKLWSETHDTCTDLQLVLVALRESADSTFGRVMQVKIHGRLYQFCQIWIIWLSLMSESMPVHFSNSLLLWYWYNSSSVFFCINIFLNV